MEDAETEEIGAGPAVHGAVDELEAMDVNLNRPVAPGLLKSSEESALILT